MLIYLENNQQIAGSDLLSVILRYDLVPIPVSIELTAYASDLLKQQLMLGKKLMLGNGTSLTIVKSQLFQQQFIKDGKRSGAIAVIAVLSGCENLVNVTKKAVAHEAVSFAEIYRSLGAKLRFTHDIKVNRFACLNGQLPTKRIAIALQKEASVVRYDIETHTVNVVRLQDLFTQDSTLYDSSAVQWLENSQANTLLNTNYLSIDDNGTDILGQISHAKNVDYMPRADSRELHNLKRILITKGVILRPLDTRLVAGNLLLINEQKYVILTSAMRFDTGSLGGSAVMASKAWLAQLSQ